MFRKKIFLFLIVAAVGMLTLSSVSFTNQIAEVSGSFVVRAGNVETGSSVPVVKTAAKIKVEALTDAIVSYVEEGVEKASLEIYAANMAAVEEARKKAEQERIARERAESKAASGIESSGQVNLSGIEAEILNLINQVRGQHGLSQLAVNQMLIDPLSE